MNELTNTTEPQIAYSECYVPFLVQLFNDKFENVLPKIKFDAIITDPPYPDYMAEEYGYYEGIIEWCKNFDYIG